jgi:DNA replication protein DnaC
MVQQAGQIAGAVLTAMSAPPTTEKPLNIKEWAEWFKFNTFGDPQLLNMVEKAARFVKAVRAGDPPYWLTLAGPSGAGKTFIAKRIYRHIQDIRKFSTKVVDGEFSYPTEWMYWPKVAQDLQQQIESDDVYHAPHFQFLALDEVGGIRDASGYVSNRLAVMLGQRMDKWTIITSNLFVEQIGERLDTRIASRLIRDRNQVVEVDVMDYALRKPR